MTLSRPITLGVAVALLSAPVLLARQDARERQVLVSITGRNDVPTTGLTAADFDVREDGKSVEVVRVAPAPPPSHLALVIDDSAALSSLGVVTSLRDALKAVIATVATSMKGTQVALVGTADPPLMRMAFTGDLSKADSVIEQFSPRSGAGGALLEALSLTLNDLQQRKATRPVVLVFLAEDSSENARVKPNVIEAALKAGGASLWTLAYESRKTGDDMEITQGMGDRSAVVSDINRRSGGVERRMNSPQSLAQAFSRMIAMIGSRYEVAYLRPAGATAAPRNFEVRSRKGGTVAAPRWAGQ
jgi:hypothetical protein